jgi:hypothetical protein
MTTRNPLHQLGFRRPPPRGRRSRWGDRAGGGELAVRGGAGHAERGAHALDGLRAACHAPHGPDRGRRGAYARSGVAVLSGTWCTTPPLRTTWAVRWPRDVLRSPTVSRRASLIRSPQCRSRLASATSRGPRLGLDAEGGAPAPPRRRSGRYGQEHPGDPPRPQAGGGALHPPSGIESPASPGRKKRRERGCTLLPMWAAEADLS